MKKVVSMLAVVAFLFTMNVNAQEPKKAKKAKAKTEKSAATAEASSSTAPVASGKSCSEGSGKKACCSAKKEEAKS